MSRPAGIYFICEEAGSSLSTMHLDTGVLRPLSAACKCHPPHVCTPLTRVLFRLVVVKLSSPPYPDYPTAFTFIHVTLHLFTLTLFSYAFYIQEQRRCTLLIRADVIEFALAYQKAIFFFFAQVFVESSCYESLKKKRIADMFDS